MKKIVAFHTTPDGLFIDLEDQPAAVGVNLKTGDVLLDEGDGPDRYQGAVIPGASLPEFLIQSTGANGVVDVQLELESHTHSVGVTNDLLSSIDWVDCANRVIKIRNSRVERIYKPISADNSFPMGVHAHELGHSIADDIVFVPVRTANQGKSGSIVITGAGEVRVNRLSEADSQEAWLNYSGPRVTSNLGKGFGFKELFVGPNDAGSSREIATRLVDELGGKEAAIRLIESLPETTSGPQTGKFRD